MSVDESIASTNLQNPSDALEFLANVAGRNDGAVQTSTYRMGHHRLITPHLQLCKYSFLRTRRVMYR